jgi:membrane-associated phospholipid phosphatase
MSSVFPALLLSGTDWLLNVNYEMYHALNGIAGRSFVFDKLLGLGLSSNLVKAGVIGACFLFTWLAGEDAGKLAIRRKILLITLVSSVFVLATTKSLSKSVFLPRPYVLSEKTYHLDGDQLVRSPQVEYNVPFDHESEKNYQELQHGQIIQNDLESFPSDHAGFFLTIALGILLAYRRAGMIAVGWTILVPLAAKVIMGQHSPLDIVVGAGIAVLVLVTMQTLLGKFGGRVLDPIVGWTLRNSALSAALMFLVIFEVTSTLDGVREVGKVGQEVAKHMVGRQ